MAVWIEIHGGDANVQICTLASRNAKFGFEEFTSVFSSVICFSRALMSSVLPCRRNQLQYYNFRFL